MYTSYSRRPTATAAGVGLGASVGVGGMGVGEGVALAVGSAVALGRGVRVGGFGTVVGDAWLWGVIAGLSTVTSGRNSATARPRISGSSVAAPAAQAPSSRM